MNTINYAEGNALIPMGDKPILIGEKIYKNLTVIARLLTPIELKRISNLMTRDGYEREMINDEIFKECLIDILGISEQVDLDSSSAGFVTLVAESIYLLSIDHVVNAEQYSNEYQQGIGLIENMCAVISRFLTISYLEVSKMPINKIHQLYAVCRQTFPNQVSEIQEKEEVTVSKVGVND